MRIFTLTALALVLMSAAALAKVPVGEQAPAFDATALDGKNLSMSSFPGKYVLIDFFATW